jgi:hypothetical protein
MDRLLRIADVEKALARAGGCATSWRAACLQ